MSTSISLPAGVRGSRLTSILAAASALVVAAAIMVALAMTGDSVPLRPASPHSPPAAPDRAALYHHSIEPGGQSLPSAAERFHHFR
jgi:hypothetical protein